MDESKKPNGRPTKYHDKLPEMLIDFFSEIGSFTLMGKEYPKIKTKESFCADIKVAKSTFDLWCTKHPNFSGAWSIAKTLQADMIINLSANRIIDPNYGKLLTVNCTGYSDKVEQTIDHKNIQINIDKADSGL